MTKRNFWLQGILLTAFSLFFRITNIGYRAWLSGKIGPEGMGLYQLIFSVFMLTVTLSTSGISLAVTRMVTAAIAAGRRETVRSVVTKCFLFCLTLSCTISFLLLTFSDFAAGVILGRMDAAPSLRILALGLPFMSLCTCMKGYFLAVDEALSTSVSDAMEQILTIFAAVLLFHVFAPQSIEAACFAAMLASTFGETVSFTTGWLLYRRSLRKNTPKQKEKGRGVLHGMFHIAVPCTLSSAARSLLATAENLLIPRELGRSGLDASAAMAAYGLLQGMAMPMLFFPSSFLSSFAFLLIPRMAKAFELGQRDHVARITEKALHAALLFGIFCAGVFFTFGGDWGRAFYQNTEAGGYLKILAPLVPLLYLDVVVDSLLKGLDEQLNSMKYNFSDSFLRVILILLCMRFYGMRAYIAILFFSSIFNAALSVRRLLQVSQVHIRTVRSVLLPGVFSGFAAALTRGILTPCTFSGIPRILLQTALCGAFYLAMLALSAALQNRREDTKIRLPSV
ncbi:MAG: oligosaccharide flippase family protein [Clostridia bacterium]|nr:oligosaccharide flippase family protein [Clostridia bacterium]